MNQKTRKISYFPGCSLATTATENNLSMKTLFRKFNIELKEIPDWNCCGSSSTPNLDEELATSLCARNLSLAPPGMDLLVACPNCNIRMRNAFQILCHHPDQRKSLEDKWGRAIDPELNIISFFDILQNSDLSTDSRTAPGESLKGLKVAPYYGCMLAQPSKLKDNRHYYAIMEKILSSLGAKALHWEFASQCCGTYLSVAKPDLITPLVNRIVQGAISQGADCIVTACAMCHLNLEVRCDLPDAIPVMHFSELLSLGLGTIRYEEWFAKHLVDPKPALQKAGVL